MMKQHLTILLILLLLPACASTTENPSARVAMETSFPATKESGFVGIDRGNDDGKGKLTEGSKLEKTIGAIDNLLGSGFDPSDIKAPGYKKAKYKSEIAKQFLLDELMGEAYDTYKEVTGKSWYPKRVAKGTKSNDPLLRKDRWLLKKGDALHDVLLSWARRAQWEMVWRADYEYPVRVGALFKGSFPKAVGDVLRNFENRTPRLYATFYKNRVVVFRNEEEK
jgi:hypothetical protein